MSTPRPDSVPLEHKATSPRAIGCFVLTISDSKTPETDTSGALIRELLTAAGHGVVGHAIVKDEPTQVAAVIREGCENSAVQAFVLTGGTGVTSWDSTFEAVEALLDKRLTLQVRVTNLEKKVFGSPQEPAHHGARGALRLPRRCPRHQGQDLRRHRPYPGRGRVGRGPAGGPGPRGSTRSPAPSGR